MIQDYILKNYSFVNPNAINVVHRGVDTEKYTPEFTPDPSWYEGWCDQYPDLENKKILTLPARLTRWKGQLDFIEIIELLVKRGERVHGLIVGSAHSKKQDYENELRNAIHSRRLEDDITMIGHRNDLKEILSISNIVFSLSTEPEAFGRTTIEALSLGTPVIGYNHGGVKEQLQSILPQGAIPVGDIGKVTDMAQSWLQSPTAPMENTRFTLELMCEKTFKIYKELTINESANS
jgi:glycosyltransferase involved in cell wall biosynthesis